MARKYKYQINSKRGIVKAVERPAGTTPIRESKGAYDPKATYSKGDTVIYGGLYYTAITGQGIPGEGDGWEISGIVSAKAVTLTLKLSKPVLDVSDGAKAVTATATATLGGQDITTGLPADGWRWTWRGKELSGETKSSTILSDIPVEVGQYPVRVTHKLFGTYAEEQVVRVDVTSKLRAELEEALEGLRQSTGDEQAAMAEILGKVNKTLTSLQEQVDKEVSNWFYPGPPSPDKEPESEWTTNQDKYRHIGDTYTSVDESGEYMGKSWRYTTEFKWQEIHDTLISKALAVAAKAQTTADGKSTTYYTQPSRYSVGDSWVLSADTTVGGKVYKKGTMLFANSSSDVYVGAHWSDILKYIDSAKLEADLRASEKKSKEAWEAYAAAKASKAGEDAVKAAKEYAEAQDAAHEERTKAYADKILTEKEQALIAAADAKANLAEKRAKAYADGKITETEQLAIDKAAAAYKAAVKKAKELDSEIQVGGRNLLRPAGYGHDKEDTNNWRKIVQDGNGVLHWTQKDDSTSPYQLFTHNKLGKGAYTLSFKADVGEGFRDSLYFTRGDVAGDIWVPAANANTTVQIREGVWLHTATYNDLPTNGANWINYYGVDPSSPVREVTLWDFKLERGSVATDWTPAPEDVQAEIDAAKEQADKAQTSTDKLRGYVDGAYKDGIITEVESKAIATYINEVEAMWSSAFGAYERVYVNPLLTGSPKTALSDAKITLAGAKDNLIGQIKRAITDGKATKAEATETERLYNVYKSALRDFQRALKVAEEAIRGIGSTFGGRNLALQTATPCRATGRDSQAGDLNLVRETAYKLSVAPVVGETYTLSFEGRAEGSIRLFTPYLLGTQRIGEFTLTTEWKKYSVTFRAECDYDVIYFYGYGIRLLEVQRLKLERGSVATDWTPAPEDITAQLEDAQTAIDTLNNCRQMLKDKKITLDKLPDSLRWIYEAFDQGKTETYGGLTLTQVIGLSNLSGKITAYLSGRNAKGAHMLAAGVTSLADTDAVSYIDYDGTAKFGNISINRDSIYVDADESKDPGSVSQVKRGRLYITRSGIWSWLDSYLSGGLDTGHFVATYEHGFQSKRVSIGGGGSSIIQAPSGDNIGLQIQGNLHVYGDKLEYNDQRILYEGEPRIHNMSDDGGSVYLTKKDSLVLVGNEALSSAHCTVTLPDADDVKVGWRCKVTTIGAVTNGSITFRTKYSSQKMFWGTDRQASSSRNYQEKANVIVIIRIPVQYASSGSAYWFVRELKAW